MLSHLALATLVLAAAPQATKHRKKSTTPPSTPVAPDVAAPLNGPNVVRTAPCVLALKGTITRVTQIPKPHRKGSSAPPSTSAPATLTSEISEQFDYELPGTLEEEVDPKGPVRFRFTPAADLNAAGARGTLQLRDNGAVSGGTPMVLSSSELTSVDPFVFEAAGRGQGLVPLAGRVYLRGRIQGPLPPGTPITMEAPSRPVVSMPLPPMQTKLNQRGISALRFQGASLWAWANSKGPFTVASTMDYQGLTGAGSVTGSVEVTFRMSATR